YGVSFCLHLEGDLDVEVLSSAVDVLVQRHETLRSKFTSVDGDPTVEVESLHFEVPLVVLSRLSQGTRSALVEKLAEAHALRPFDLSRAPLLRVHLIELDSKVFLLLMSMHHIISDGWSMGVFVREFTAAYGALKMGRLPSLSPL